MEKRGQVTIFIIIVIIIVAIVAVLFLFKDRLGGDKKGDLDVAPIVNFIQSCMDETLNSSIYAVAENGGYSGYSYLSRESNEGGVGYYILENKNYFPSKELVENQIKEHFDRKFFLCINGFYNFENYGIEQGMLDSYIEVGENEVRLIVEYPLRIKQGESISLVKDFNSVVASRLGVVYDSVSDYMIQQKNFESTCLECFNVAIQNDIYIDMENYYDKSVVFTFLDTSLEADDKPIEWRFANKY